MQLLCDEHPSYVAPVLPALARSDRARAADARWAAYQAAFDECDTRGYGRLAEGDLRRVLSLALGDGVAPSEESLAAVSRACADGDLLTCEELLLVVASHEELPAIVSSSSDAAILAAFVSMGGSSDRSGHVDTGRIRSVINEVGLTIGIDELLSLLDTDQSGSIEYDEFKCLFEEEEDTLTGDVNPLSPGAHLLSFESSDSELATAAASPMAQHALLPSPPPSRTPATLTRDAISTIDAAPSTPLHPRPPTAPRSVQVAPSPRQR